MKRKENTMLLPDFCLSVCVTVSERFHDITDIARVHGKMGKQQRYFLFPDELFFSPTIFFFHLFDVIMLHDVDSHCFMAFEVK